MTFWSSFKRPITALAPMEDVTDSVFRRLVLQCGRPTLFFTEFTSCEGLCSKGKDAVIHRLKFKEEERPLIAQIWGIKPECFYKSALLLREMGFDGVDINMGCPVSKIIKKGSCSALIENPNLAAELIAATREGAGDLPLSVKTRIGFRSPCTERWIGFLLEHNLDAITVHGRTARQLSKVPADWQEIGRAVRLRNEMGAKTIILGNGDVSSFAEIEEKVELYGVDGVMIGRGIFENIFIFNSDSSCKPLRERPPFERLQLLLKHMQGFVDEWGDGRDLSVLKRFFKVYVSDFERAAELRAELMQARGAEEIRVVVEKFLCGERQ